MSLETLLLRYLEQSLTEPPHYIEIHLMRLWVSLLRVLILTLHNYIPAEKDNVTNFE